MKSKTANTIVLDSIVFGSQIRWSRGGKKFIGFEIIVFGQILPHKIGVSDLRSPNSQIQFRYTPNTMPIKDGLNVPTPNALLTRLPLGTLDLNARVPNTGTATPQRLIRRTEPQRSADLARERARYAQKTKGQRLMHDAHKDVHRVCCCTLGTTLGVG